MASDQGSPTSFVPLSLLCPLCELLHPWIIRNEKKKTANHIKRIFSEYSTLSLSINDESSKGNQANQSLDRGQMVR